MNTRERFLAVMRFEEVSRTLEWEFGYWGGTVERWYSEGLPRVHGLPPGTLYAQNVVGPGLYHWLDSEWALDRDVDAYVKYDAGLRRVPVDAHIHPLFPVEVLEEDDHTQVIREEHGIIKRIFKDFSNMPQFLKRPVESRTDWELLKERLQPTLAERLPATWPQLVEEYSARDYPLAIGGFPCGFFGMAREFMGFEGLSVALYEDRDLVRDIMDYLADFWVQLYDRFLSAYNDRLHIDCAHIWEDMCFNGGPLISPELFRELMLPCYKKLTGLFRDYGVDIVLVDTDGDHTKLTDLFLEGGVTGLYPFEVAAGMDVVAVREAYPKLQMLGGIDKRALAQGRAAVDAELERRVTPIVRKGGYIPYVDHLVPPDVSWENFVYYRAKLNSIVEGTESR